MKNFTKILLILSNLLIQNCKQEQFYSKKTRPGEIDYGLPKNLKPYFYDIRIKPYIGPFYGEKSFKFDANLSLSFTCLNPTKRILLHSKNLTINNIKLNDLSNRTKKIEVQGKHEYDEIKDFLIINLNQFCVENNNYTIIMNYTGLITDSLSGLYRSSYIDSKGVKQYLVATQFQPTDARRVFPGFDEPEMKSQFQISILRHKNFTSSSSNTLLIKTEKINDSFGDWFVDYYEKTPFMSTYLVAFVISNFKSVKQISPRHKIQIDVIARPDLIDKKEVYYGLNDTTKLFDYFVDFFQIPYQLNKSTQAILPDFSGGGMENWGLITYNEAAYVYNQTSTSILNKRDITNLISHEIAHQWFGNLVTPKTWDDLWLNEGFASYFEYLGSNFTHPEYKEFDYFIINKLSVMVKDSLESSHPVKFKVNNPDEIFALFDELSYIKSSSLISMINSFISSNTFRTAIINYLNKFKFKNAEQDDLWKEMTQQAHKDKTLDKNLDIKTIMDSWTLKKGYPVVQIDRILSKISPGSDLYDTELKVTQKWFLLNPSSKLLNETDYDNYKWFVPFSYTTKSNLSLNLIDNKLNWLKPKDNELNINIGKAKQNNWILGNLKSAGFYRVNYDMDNWNMLTDQLNDPKGYNLIDVTTRAQLLDDSFNLGRSELIDPTIFLKLAKYLKYENNSIPFMAFDKGIRYINRLFSSNKTLSDLVGRFETNLYSNSYNKLGWEVDIEDLNTKYLQLYSKFSTCLNSNMDCVNKSKSYFINWMNKNKSMPADLKDVILDTAIRNGNQSDWIRLFDLANRTNDSTEKYLYLSSLTQSRDPKLLSMLLKNILEIDFVRIQFIPSLLIRIFGNNVGRNLTWEFVKQNWTSLYQRIDSFLLSQFFTSGPSRYFNTQKDLDDLKSFLNKNNQTLGVISSLKNELIESVQSNLRWMNVSLEKISKWLLENI